MQICVAADALQLLSLVERVLVALTEQDLLEGGPELRIENVVEDRVERAVEVAEPEKHAVEDVEI